MKLSLKERQLLVDFAAELDGQFTLEQYLAAGKNWARLSATWFYSGLKGSSQLRLICWYNATYKPDADEHRPNVIIQAALEVRKPKRKQSLFTLN